MFCSQCGTALEPEAGFCSQCGSPAGETPVPHRGILGVLPQVIEVKGFLGQGTRFMNLIVTDHSLILAIQNDRMELSMDSLGELLDKALLASGEQWRQRADTYGFSTCPWDCYLTMGAQEIVREHADNREIPLAELHSVRLRLDEDRESHSDTLILQAGSHSLDLDLPWANGNQARQLLSQVVQVQVDPE